MEIEQVPDIVMFRQNTAAFIHELEPSHVANVDGDGSYVRVQVLTNADALDRDKQLAVVARFTAIVATAAGDPHPTLKREAPGIVVREAQPTTWSYTPCYGRVESRSVRQREVRGVLMSFNEAGGPAAR